MRWRLLAQERNGQSFKRLECSEIPPVEIGMLLPRGPIPTRVRMLADWLAREIGKSEPERVTAKAARRTVSEAATTAG